MDWHGKTYTRWLNGENVNPVLFGAVFDKERFSLLCYSISVVNWLVDALRTSDLGCHIGDDYVGVLRTLP